MNLIDLNWVWVDAEQGVIFPAGVWVFPAGNLQNPQEMLTKTLIIKQILFGSLLLSLGWVEVELGLWQYCLDIKLNKMQIWLKEKGKKKELSERCFV